LAEYERTEKLWNPRHPDYKYNTKRSVYGELADPLEAICHKRLTGAEIFAVLKELRGRYRRELNKLNALGGKYKSRLWYFEKMHFLRSVIENRKAEREAKVSNTKVICWREIYHNPFSSPMRAPRVRSPAKRTRSPPASQHCTTKYSASS